MGSSPRIPTTGDEAPAGPKGAASCRHCGSRVPEGRRESAFCCEGCAYVHRLICGEGLDRFYDLRDKPLQPVGSTVFHERRYDWLAERTRSAEAEAETVARLDLAVHGISCAGCAWLLERLFRDQQGALRLEVNAIRGSLRLHWIPGGFDPVVFAREAQRFGYRIAPLDEAAGGRRSGSGVGSREGSDLMRRIGLCAAFALNAMLFTLPRYLGMSGDFPYAGLFRLIALLCATLAMIVGGSYFIERAFRTLRRGYLHLDLPIALGLIAAYAGSLVGWLLDREELVYFDFVALFVLLMLGGRWLQERALEANRRRLDERPDAEGQVILRSGDGAERRVAIESIEPGQELLLESGRWLPLAGRVEADSAEVSLESINGESEPRLFVRGQRVPAGAFNLGPTVWVRAEERWQDSLFRRLIGGEEGAEPVRDPRFERILQVYLLAVLGLAAAGALFWLQLQGWGAGWARALQVAVSVLVVSCPCALGVALPLVDDLAAGRLRRAGVFIRRPLWPHLPRLRRLVFDKTGTLTLETPTLSDPGALDGLGLRERQALEHLVTGSLHPVARSLREALRIRPAPSPGTSGDAPEAAGSFGPVAQETGMGVWTRDQAGRLWSLGRPDWRPEQGSDRDCTALPEGRVPAVPGAEGRGLSATAGEVVPPASEESAAGAHFQRDGEVLLELAFVDQLRFDARAEVAALRARGLEVFIASGDRPEKVARMLDELGLPSGSGLGGLKPREKADWVRQHGATETLAVGDGANDSLMFEAAAVKGVPAMDRSLIEAKGDFILAGGGIGGVRTLLDWGQRRRRTVHELFGFSVTYNAVAVSICLAGWMNPLLAAVLMPLSSILTLGWGSLRMRR